MPYVYNEDTGNYDYVPDSTTGTEVVWTPGLVADLADSEGDMPPPGGGNTGGNTGGGNTGGGGGVDWKHDKNNYPYGHDPHPANDPGGSWEWYWNGTEWMTRQGPPGTVSTGGGKNGGGGSYPGWQMAPFGGGGGGYAFPMLELPTPPTLDPYVPEEWTAPKPSDVYDDPSYKFRFDEGMRPVMTQRAAQGILNTGATLKALTRYGQNFASNEYDRIYNRAADSYDRRNNEKYRAWSGNRQNALDTYDRLASKARDEYAPKAHWADVQFQRDWDVYKYQQDDAFRRWAKEGDWANTLSTSYPRSNE